MNYAQQLALSFRKKVPVFLGVQMTRSKLLVAFAKMVSYFKMDFVLSGISVDVTIMGMNTSLTQLP